MKTSRMRAVPLAMRPRGARVQLAQNFQLARGRLRRFINLGCVPHLPAGARVDLLARDAGMNGNDGHFARLWIGLEHTEIRYQPGRALGIDAEARAMAAAFAVTERGDEIELVDKAALALI